MKIAPINLIQFYKRAPEGETKNLEKNKYISPDIKLHSQPAADTVSFKRAVSLLRSPFIHDPRELDLHSDSIKTAMLIV